MLNDPISSPHHYNFPELGEDQSSKPLKIAFGILSAWKSAPVIDQLALSLFPHPVYVHHDFSKDPDFFPRAENVHILQNTVITTWGEWSFLEACFLLMDAALEDPEVTHFQFLSQTCLPVRPLQEFETYISQNRPDVMIDILSLSKDEDALYSHGWRYFSTIPWVSKYLSKFANRACEKFANASYGKHPQFKQSHLLNIRLSTPKSSLLDRVIQYFGKLVIKTFSKLALIKLTGSGVREFAVGGLWFGANRRVMQWLLRVKEENIALTKHFEKCHLPDEAYLHTLLLNAKLAGLPLRIYPSNHVVFWDECLRGPDTLSKDDIERIAQSHKFFSRKFSMLPNDELRNFFLKDIQKQR